MAAPAGLLLAAACASTPAPAIDSVAFAPEIGVSLASMERTSSGLYLREIAVGEGSEARTGQHVSVYYVVWLPDGTQVDGVAPPNEPMQFRLGDRDLIRGFNQGIVGMRVGGQRMLVVPPSLGYGHRRVGEIPGNAVLVFVVELAGLR